MAERVVVRIGEHLEVRKLREDLSYWRRRQRQAYETETAVQLRRLCAREIAKIHDIISGYENRETCSENID